MRRCRRTVLDRFDQRSSAVLASTAGAVFLPVFAVVSPSIVRPGQLGWLIVIWAYSIVSMVITVAVGRLGDRLFVLLGAGGMVGVAGSAYLLNDAGTAHAVLVLLATIPALAAMHSRPSVVVAFVVFALTLGVTLSVLLAPSLTSFAVAGGATIMAITVPTAMVAALRQSLMRLVARLEVVGDTDPLTGVWNRRGLEARLHTVFDTAIAQHSGVGVAIVDIDHFKDVNDRYGHSTGDRVLIDVVTAIKRSAPPLALIARVGGEEFFLISLAPGQIALVDCVERVRTRIARDTDVTVSVGAVYTEIRHATTPMNAVDHGSVLIDELSRCADQHLYAAKRLGRNRVVTGDVDAVEWPLPTTLPHTPWPGRERRGPTRYDTRPP